MRSKAMGLLAGACVAYFGSTGLAAVSYSYVTDFASYNVSGGSATVNVYLQETLTGASVTQIGASGASSGLDGAAFKVQLDSGNSAKLLDLAFNPAFDAGVPFNSKSVTSTVASLTESTGFTSNGVGLNADARVFLGSITLGNDLGVGLTTFTVLPYNNDAGNIISRLGGGVMLDDPTPPASAVFTAAVPEPVFFGMMGVISGGLLLRRRTAEAELE